MQDQAATRKRSQPDSAEGPQGAPTTPKRRGGASTTAKASQEEVDTPFKIIHEVMKAGLDDKIWLEMIDKDKQEKDLADKGYSQVDVGISAEAPPDQAKGKLGVEIYCSMSVRVFSRKYITHRSEGSAKTLEEEDLKDTQEERGDRNESQGQQDCLDGTLKTPERRRWTPYSPKDQAKFDNKTSSKSPPTRSEGD